MKRTALLVLLPLTIVLTLPAFAFFCRQELIPNNPTEPVGETCGFCHIFPTGGGPRTPFGEEVALRVEACEPFWGPDIAALDSDGDGFTNGEELQDPEGQWEPGDPNPGDPDRVSNPGNPNATPPPTPTPTPSPTPQPNRDLNNDGAIDHTDLFILASNWYRIASQQ